MLRFVDESRWNGGLDAGAEGCRNSFRLHTILARVSATQRQAIARVRASVYNASFPG